MGPLGRGRNMGRWGQNDGGHPMGGRFEPRGNFRGGGGGRGFPIMGAARGPRDSGRGGFGGGGAGVGRPGRDMDHPGRGGRGGGRHDFYEPPFPNAQYPYHGPLHSQERARGLGGGGSVGGRFVDGPVGRGGGDGVPVAVGRPPFRGRGRIYRGRGAMGAAGPGPGAGIGGRFDASMAIHRGGGGGGVGPPMRDLGFYGHRYPNSRGISEGLGPGPDRMARGGSVSSSSSFPKDDYAGTVVPSNMESKPLDDMAQAKDSSESIKRSLPPYSSMSNGIEEETGSAVGTKVPKRMDEHETEGPPGSDPFVHKKTKHESIGSSSSSAAAAADHHHHQYGNSMSHNDHDNDTHTKELSTDPAPHEGANSSYGERESIQSVEKSNSVDRYSGDAGSGPSSGLYHSRHVPFDRNDVPFDRNDVPYFERHSGRGPFLSSVLPRRGMPHGGGGRHSFPRGRGGGGGGGPPFVHPYPPNPLEMDGYGPESHDYAVRNTRMEGGGRSGGGGGPGFGMGRGPYSPPSHSTPPLFAREEERPYGMGGRAPMGARGPGRFHGMEWSGNVGGRGRTVDGRGFHKHRSIDHNNYNTRPGLQGPMYQQGFGSRFKHEKDSEQQQQQQEDQEQQQSQQQQQYTHLDQSDTQIQTTTDPKSPERHFTSKPMETPTPRQEEVPVDIVPPSPPPAPPSALVLARARLADLNETMEFHYARHLQLTKEHEIIEMKVNTLKRLPIGIDAFKDHLDGLVLQGDEHVDIDSS